MDRSFFCIQTFFYLITTLGQAAARRLSARVVVIEDPKEPADILIAKIQDPGKQAWSCSIGKRSVYDQSKNGIHSSAAPTMWVGDVTNKSQHHYVCMCVACVLTLFLFAFWLDGVCARVCFFGCV